jgi:hypothetical protein
MVRFRTSLLVVLPALVVASLAASGASAQPSTPNATDAAVGTQDAPERASSPRAAADPEESGADSSASPTHPDVQAAPPAESGSAAATRRGARDEGRGLAYGTHVVSPVYTTAMTPTSAQPLRPSAGAGLSAHVGWELPLGFTVELHGGFAVNAVDRPAGLDAMRSTITRAEGGVRARYVVDLDAPVRPFVALGGTLRGYFFDYVDTEESLRAADGELAGAIDATLGTLLELAPYFAIEAGLALDYTLPGSIFGDGFLALTPFVGARLFVYDASGF